MKKPLGYFRISEYRFFFGKDEVNAHMILFSEEDEFCSWVDMLSQIFHKHTEIRIREFEAIPWVGNRSG